MVIFLNLNLKNYETVSVERLKKVIAGEQGGISKDVDWQSVGPLFTVN